MSKKSSNNKKMNNNENTKKANPEKEKSEQTDSSLKMDDSKKVFLKKDDLKKTGKTNEKPQDGTEQSASDNTANEEKPVMPRKRKITRNIQMWVTAGVACFALLFLIVWKLFFNQSILGVWNYNIEGSYTETFDIAESDDMPSEIETQYSQRVCYEFTDQNECIVTLGTMSVPGSFEMASTEEYGNVVSIYVAYNGSPVVYGSFKYEITGNAFTGRKLKLTNVSYDDDVQTFERGEGEYPITPFEGANIDDKLTGSWYDETNALTYEFTSDGKMIRTSDGGLCVEHYYTIMQDNVILAKYAVDSEQSETYGYEFKDDRLYIDNFELIRLND